MTNCPLCRAPTVLQANPCEYARRVSRLLSQPNVTVANIDYGLLNFMADWFPIESREKLRTNEREVTQEQLEVLGIADVHGCRIM